MTNINTYWFVFSSLSYIYYVFIPLCISQPSVMLLGNVTLTKNSSLPVSVAERSNARVCCRSLAGIAGSNPAGGIVCCQVQVPATG